MDDIKTCNPCMLKYDGTVDYYLDPNDYTKKEDGTQSDYGSSDYEGNVVIEVIFEKQRRNMLW